MIIPVGHDRTVGGWPWVTIGIIAICTVMQIYSTAVEPSEAELQSLGIEMMQADTEEEMAEIEARAMDMLERIPAWRWGYRTGSGMHKNALFSAFLHAGWIHLIGNMLFLWLAGAVIEDRWGRVPFALFYVASAVLATMIFDGTYDGPPTILVGASGAVSACLGAFLVLNHDAQIKLLYWYWYASGTFQMRAYAALPLWLLNQFLWAYLESEGAITGVAYWAHIGGFAVGLAAAFGIGAIMRQGDEAKADDSPLGQGPGDEMAQIDARYQRCMDAIANNDPGTLRGNASRVVIDLAKRDSHERVVALYRAIAEGAPTTPFTDRALLDAATAADHANDAGMYVAIAGNLMKQHPGSRLIPQVMWRVAELQRDGGRADLAAKTLGQLAQRYPNDPDGVRARDALAGRS